MSQFRNLIRHRRARALEYILSARGVDAIEAAAIGWVDRAFWQREKVEGEG